MKIPRRLQRYIIESQTYSLKNEPFYIKILAMFYKVLGRRLFAKLLITSKDCKSCKLCAEKCPNKAMNFWFNNPRRNRKCKGCLLCVYQCPNRAIVMPLSTIFGVLLLLFLPYNAYIREALPFQIPSLTMVGDEVLAFILWSIGYVVAIFLFRNITFFISALPIVKRMMRSSFLKKIYRAIHPIQIFPVIVPRNYKNE